MCTVDAPRLVVDHFDVHTYLYISDSKVDAYLGDIKKIEKKKLALSLKINVGILEVGARTELGLLENRIHRLKAVVAVLRASEQVGSTDSGLPWIEGVVDATAATFEASDNLMFYFSRHQTQYLGLAGSAHHIIGNIRPEAAASSLTHLPTLLFNLENFVERYGTSVQKDDAALQFNVYSGIDSASGSTWTTVLNDVARRFDGRPTERISFLARRLIRDEVWNGVRFTLASPLYMCLEDVAVSPTALKLQQEEAEAGA